MYVCGEHFVTGKLFFFGTLPWISSAFNYLQHRSASSYLLGLRRTIASTNINNKIIFTSVSLFLGRKSDDPEHPDYVPTITKIKSISSQLSPHKSKKSSKNAIARRERRLNRTQKRDQNITKVFNEENNGNTFENTFIEKEKGTDEIDELRCKNIKLQEEINGLKKQLQRAENHIEKLENCNKQYIQKSNELEKHCQILLSEKTEQLLKYDLLKSKYDNINCKSISEDENKLNFYTGISTVAIFDVVFDFIKKSIIQSDTSKLSKKEIFIMVLMKFRLGLLEQDLAYRFGISQPSVSRILHKWIPVLATRLSFLVKWPEREELRKTLPACFRESFPKCCVIIDCFEVFIEKPSDLMARAQTYSSYKSHNTVKVLVGITPQGTISFISKPWGGRVSDVYLTENCGLLKNLLPGDQVLADRGFTVQESVGLYCAELKIPAFTRGKSQLEQKLVDQTREIATVRIHVERVIGLLRNKFTILQGILPIKMIMKTDDGTCKLTHILTICSALCNLCNSVIPVE